MKIVGFREAIAGAVNLLDKLLGEYSEKIEDAYIHGNSDGEGSEQCKIGLAVTLKHTNKGIEILADISFVESRVKDSAKGLVSAQNELPGTEI